MQKRFFLYIRYCSILVLALFIAGCATPQKPQIDKNRLIEDLRVLSADDMEGRATGSAGNAKARAYILARMKEIGLEPYRGSFQQSFIHQPDKGPRLKPFKGVNLVGMVRGKARAGQTLYVTAHYDHVGIRGGDIYNGADDNASGVAAVLALAQSLVEKPPLNDVVFVFFDAEERGLVGARKFVSANMDEWGCTALNVNLDMVSRNDKNELYMAGGYHSEALNALMQAYKGKSSISLKMGHDRPEDGAGDWTKQSDHAAFHAAGVPFLYFGVEDHPHYHQPSDDFVTVPQAFFHEAAREIAHAVYYLDENMASVGRVCSNPKWTEARFK